jgi:cell division protein FtsQ
VAVLLAIGLCTALTRSPFLRIEEIEVSGNVHLSADDVIARAGVPAEETLLGVEEDEIESRLAEDPWIESAEISRGLPSTLRIHVEERTAIALVDTGMSFWAIDGNARVLSESQPETATALPAIRNVPDFVAEPGTVTESDILRNAVRVLVGVSPALLAEVRVVNAPSVNETGLVTADSIEIMLGEASRLDEKSAVVLNILAERRAEVVFIDVRSVERPISRGLNQ